MDRWELWSSCKWNRTFKNLEKSDKIILYFCNLKMREPQVLNYMNVTLFWRVSWMNCIWIYSLWLNSGISYDKWQSLRSSMCLQIIKIQVPSSVSNTILEKAKFWFLIINLTVKINLKNGENFKEWRPFLVETEDTNKTYSSSVNFC